MENISNLKKQDTKRDFGFIQGFCCAVSVMISMEGQVTTQIKELFQGGVGQITLSGLKRRGVHELDLEVLENYWYDLH